MDKTKISSHEEQVFNLSFNNPLKWWQNAINLKLAADKISFVDKNHKTFSDIARIENVILFPVYLMLIGLAFEVVLKGLRIARGEVVIQDGKLKRDFKIHELKSHLKKIYGQNFKLSKEEEKILNDLTVYIKWAGRYPIPPKTQKIFDKEFSTDDHKVIEKLWLKFESHLSKLCNSY